GPGASGGNRAHLDAGVVGGLAARNAWIETIAGLGTEARFAARQGVEPRPSIAGPDHSWQNVLGHACDGFEATALIGEFHPAAGGDSAGSRVLRMNPQLRVGLGPCEHGQGAAVVVE